MYGLGKNANGLEENLPSFNTSNDVDGQAIETARSAEPIVVDGTTLHVSASIGVTLYPQAMLVTAEQRSHQAEKAMDQSKRKVKIGFRLFSKNAHHDAC